MDKKYEVQAIELMIENHKLHEEIELSNMQICNIINQLRSKVVDFYGEPRTQWEVIEEITKSNLALNKDIGGIKW